MSALHQSDLAESLRQASCPKIFLVELKTPVKSAADPASLFRYRVFKRALDLFVSCLALPFLLPIFLLISVVLYVDCPGPIFFSHRRIRRTGSYFGMWKFRTMCVDADEVLAKHLLSSPEARAEWAATHKLRCDPRITRFGAFLRRTSLDELPQIWNVLNGTMSLVGPRPIVDAEVQRYGEHFDCYMRVKPGVTGIWQVSGRSRVTYETRVMLDCLYVQRWSLTKDVVLLLGTVVAVFHQDGAY